MPTARYGTLVTTALDSPPNGPNSPLRALTAIIIRFGHRKPRGYHAPPAAKDPPTHGGRLKPNHVTSSHVVVAFWNDQAAVRGKGWHLAALKPARRAAMGTLTKYQQQLPRRSPSGPTATTNNGNGVHTVVAS